MLLTSCNGIKPKSTSAINSVKEAPNLTTNQNQEKSAMKATMIYVGDPMCSWCYGLSPELKDVMEHFKDQLNFEVVMGGLRPYNKETMSDLKSFLTHHWEDVNKASGQEFNYKILDRQDLAYDTEPPCRAVVAVRQMDGTKAIPFFKESQKLFYKENMDMNDTESYIPTIQKLGLDPGTFRSLFESDNLKQLVKEDFAKANALGANSFPTLLLKADEVQLLSKGYRKSEVLIPIIESYLKEL